MIKGSKLVGRSVVDMDAAEKMGKVKEIIVQSDGERVAGFVVSHSESILGTGGTRRTISASALHAIGPDAITVHGGAQTTTEFDGLPRMSDVIGRKMVTQSGRLLGAIGDILIDPADGTIVGFVVGEGVKSKLENMFTTERGHAAGYVRANADLQVGADLIVAPDDAFVEGEPETTGEGKDALAGTAEAVSQRQSWGEPRPARTSPSPIWRRRPTASTASSATAGDSGEVEGWIPGNFGQSARDEERSAERGAPMPHDPESPPPSPS